MLIMLAVVIVGLILWGMHKAFPVDLHSAEVQQSLEESYLGTAAWGGMATVADVDAETAESLRQAQAASDEFVAHFNGGV